MNSALALSKSARPCSEPSRTRPSGTRTPGTAAAATHAGAAARHRRHTSASGTSSGRHGAGPRRRRCVRRCTAARNAQGAASAKLRRMRPGKRSTQPGRCSMWPAEDSLQVLDGSMRPAALCVHLADCCMRFPGRATQPVGGSM
eukprot:125841-Chlamydomonas_euryale.AAC.6